MDGWMDGWMDGYHVLQGIHESTVNISPLTFPTRQKTAIITVFFFKTAPTLVFEELFTNIGAH